MDLYFCLRTDLYWDPLSMDLLNFGLRTALYWDPLHLQYDL
jgi:hypothetical protein